MPVYALDSNIFIQAHRSIYPLDVATTFWDVLKNLAEEGKIISIDKVKDEIDANEDELKVWIDSNLPDDFFKSTNNQAVVNEYSLMAPWAHPRADHYQQGAINEFLQFDKADAWLISYCKAYNDTLVTQEVSNPNQKNRIPIPQPCIDLGVSYCNMIEMFRRLGVTF